MTVDLRLRRGWKFGMTVGLWAIDIHFVLNKHGYR
jgi:hypothetical protein